jgi:hypothetical protein
VIVKVTTRNGSVYRLDYENKTWERVGETSTSGALRTDGRGTWTEVYLPGEGFPLVISGPPVDPEMEMRQITTSPVTNIEDVE